MWNGAVNIAADAAGVRQTLSGRLLRRHMERPGRVSGARRAERRLLDHGRQVMQSGGGIQGSCLIGEADAPLPGILPAAATRPHARQDAQATQASMSAADRSMRFWHSADQPRERLLDKGAEALGDAELLAVLLGSGARGLSALELARSIIGRFGSLAQVLRRSPGDLQDFRGVGAAKASRIAAAFELTARLDLDDFRGGSQIRTPDDIARRFIPLMRRLNHERLYAVLLNAAGQLLREVLVTEGILNQSLVHPREVYRSAISESAAAVIVVHNHPSGSWRPSRSDLEATAQLEESGAILGIPLLDHIIIAGNGYFSLARAGLLRSVPGTEYNLRTNTAESSSH